MAQLRLLDFGAPRKSQYINEHFVGVVPTKRVYRGYSVRANSPADLNLNINLDGAASSVLMTEEGVRVEETGDLSNAVTISPHATLDRIDYVVAAHQYTNQNNPQTYEVIEGTAGSPPSPPASVPAYKVLLATVYVPAGATAITDDLINQSDYVSMESVIDRSGFIELRPDPQDAPDNTVFVNGGTYVQSDGSDVVTVADDVASAVTFPVVSGAGKERYDLLTLDDSGVAARVGGTEDNTGSADAPSYPSDKQVIAEVLVNEASDVRITDSDIRDVRFFFNLGGGTGGGGGTCPEPTIYQIFTATQNQTVFNLTSSYDVGTNSLWVFRNGNRQTVNSDYVETDSTTVTFNTNLNAGEEIVMIQIGAAVGDDIVTARESQVATAGQTVFNLSFSYTPGGNDLFVFSGGVLMRPGASNDYVETDGSTVTFNTGRSASEVMSFVRIGVSSAAAMKLWEKHTATAGQTTFNLTGEYTVGGHSLQVFRNGKLLTVTDEYTETDPTTVTLVTGAVVGDVLVFMVAGGDIVSCTDSGVIVREIHTATANQTVFDLGFNYTVGSDGLQVSRNGQIQYRGTDYTETDQDTVTFGSGLNSGDKVEFKNYCKVQGVNEGVLSWHLFPSVTVGQTAFTIPFRYAVGTHQLKVYRNGAYQVVDQDYTEDSATQITFNTAIATTTEEIVVEAVANARAGSRKHLMAFHDDAQDILAPGQTYRDLVIECTSNTQVVIKSGSKVLADNWTDAIVANSDITVDITSSGANGLDQGVEASDTWYYIHLIKDTINGTVAGLLSVNKDNPLLPGTYNVHRCVGAVRNDSSSDFRNFFQQNDFVTSAPYLSLAISLSSATYTSFDTSVLVPSAMTAEIQYRLATQSSTGNTNPSAQMSLDGSLDSIYADIIHNGVSGTTFIRGNRQVTLASRGSTVYAKVGDGVNDLAHVYVEAYRLNL